MTNATTPAARLDEAKRRLQSIVTPRQTTVTTVDTVATVATTNTTPEEDSSSTATGYFIPKEAIQSSRPHEMIAIVGGPGSGKTTSCLTFPNRIWLDFDHKLPINEISVPFWSSAFCDTICKPSAGYKNSNRRDAFLFWLRDNHKKFVEEQTVVLDTWTFLMDAFNEQTNAEDDRMQPKNSFWFWKQKVRYAEEVINFFKAMSCRVVVNFHETRERDDQDRFTGKIRPVMDGSFKDKLLGYFTDVYRQVKDPIERDEKGRRVTHGTELAVKQGWFWQLVGDDIMDCNMNPTLGAKVRAQKIKIISADYNEIIKIYNS